MKAYGTGNEKWGQVSQIQETQDTGKYSKSVQTSFCMVLPTQRIVPKELLKWKTSSDTFEIDHVAYFVLDINQSLRFNINNSSKDNNRKW